jgi:hypothetical protein
MVITDFGPVEVPDSEDVDAHLLRWRDEDAAYASYVNRLLYRAFQRGVGHRDVRLPSVRYYLRTRARGMLSPSPWYFPRITERAQ